MKKKLLYTLIGVIVFLILLYIIQPIRMPRFMFRQYVLRVTPIGTHMDDVLIVIEEHNRWSYMGSVKSIFEMPTATEDDWVQGDNLIVAFAGQYSILFTRYVAINWWFDEEGYLIEIRVRKDI